MAFELNPLPFSSSAFPNEVQKFYYLVLTVWLIFFFISITQNLSSSSCMTHTKYIISYDTCTRKQNAGATPDSKSYAHHVNHSYLLFIGSLLSQFFRLGYTVQSGLQNHTCVHLKKIAPIPPHSSYEQRSDPRIIRGHFESPWQLINNVNSWPRFFALWWLKGFLERLEFLCY